VKSFDPRRPPRSHFVSVAKRRLPVTGCHNRPFDATENRLITVRLAEEIGFLVSIRRLVEAAGIGLQILAPRFDSGRGLQLNQWITAGNPNLQKAISVIRQSPDFLGLREP
jgi:hypothetical protein